MSVIVMGMEMPKNCVNCPICHTNWDNYAYCAIGKSETCDDKRPDDCPLKSVDELVEKIHKEQYEYEGRR